MANSPPPNSWIGHVEAFVDVSRPPSQQSASIDAIAALVKKDLLTLETLVREMELYLTTTDNVIRARGILLLAEILSRLTLKPSSISTISSLAGFFTSRLADWQVLRGALVGCLALLRRKSTVGMVVNSDVKSLAQSYLTNVQVRSLAVHDRKLCFELLLCLMDAYPDTVKTLGDDFIYGICDAIEEETDPPCLMLTFCLVETLMRTFQDPSCSVASFAEDIFDILGRYFPIFFTHPRSDDFVIKRDDLSRALMNAYCSSPLFEPFVIPLLLEKLSSSVPLAKLDSLKYLNNCIIQYGAGKMVKHAKAIWFALKDVIFNFSPQGTVISMISESTGDMVSQEGQIVKEALICLQTAISQLNFPGGDSFINLILDDHDISAKFEYLSSERSYSETSEENLHHLSALGAILSIASKVSTDCCSRVFQIFFPRLMNLLGVPISSPSNACFMEKMSNILNFGALYLCIELLASCQELTSAVQDLSQQVQDTWWSLLNNSSVPLTYVLKSTLINLCSTGSTVQEHAFYAVKGLQVLATFPGDCSPISEVIYEDILAVLVSIITGNHDDTFLWNLSLKALTQIGLYIEKVHDSEKGTSYKKIVVERIVFLLSLDDSTICLAQKLEALSELGVTGPEYMSMVIQGIEEAIISNFSKACVDGNLRSAEVLVPLLECYSNRVLPWCHKSDRIEQVAMQFAVNIWNVMETSSAFSISLERKGLLDSSMMAMKCAVSHCTEEGQGHIVQKAYDILLSTTSSPLESLFCPSSKLMTLQFIPDVSGLSCIDTVMPVTRPLSQVLTASFSCKDEWLVSLFASVVIALRPVTPLPDVHTLIKLFMANLLRGHIPAAQALASIINKWPADDKIEVPSTCKLDEVIGVILESTYAVLFSSPLKQCNFEKDLSCIRPNSLQMHAIDGLAWVGRGLILRGHERLKEIAMILMKCMLPSQNIIITSEHPNESENGHSQDGHLLVAKSAADAFHILLSDSEVCLTKKFHSKIRPLYKQRFFSSMLPVLLSSMRNCNSPSTSFKYVLCRAFGHVISGTPLAAVVADSKKVVHPLLDGLSVLGSELLNKEMTYSLLLVLSGILMDENGRETVMENVHIIISHLIRLISYPHSMLVRETAIQCLVAMSALPHSQIYPMRPQVLRALSKSLDDPKRAIRKEAVRCHQAWASIASKSLHL